MDLDLISDSRLIPKPHLRNDRLSSQPTGSKLLTPPTSQKDPNQTGAVIAKIERIFESITDCILDEKKQLVIKLKSRTKADPIANQDATGQKPRIRTISFPNKSSREAWRFTAVLRILELSHEALVTGIVTTKRDIYYREPQLFMKQAIVDRYVDDIAYTFGVNRDALNIVAAAKGLVAGAFSITRKDGTTINYALESEGLLIHNTNEIETINTSKVNWILVIEKEATFRTLTTSKYADHSASGPGLLITAKGYPDILTRQFLHFLSVTNPEIPIYSLVDYDPHGFSIHNTYKYSSTRLSHETNLVLPTIRFLGLKSSDFLHHTNEDDSEGEMGIDGRGILYLSVRDRKIATGLLERAASPTNIAEMGDEDELEIEVETENREREEMKEMRREIQVMLFLGVKAEIQILGNAERLGRWLDGKLGYERKDGYGIEGLEGLLGGGEENHNGDVEMEMLY